MRLERKGILILLGHLCMFDTLKQIKRVCFCIISCPAETNEKQWIQDISDEREGLLPPPFFTGDL